jgi:hypothetical protein
LEGTTEGDADSLGVSFERELRPFLDSEGAPGGGTSEIAVGMKGGGVPAEVGGKVGCDGSKNSIVGKAMP